METATLLEDLVNSLASVVPSVDVRAEHDRWQAGIGPFEEERVIEIERYIHLPVDA
jgi:hypothetical protein